jgi:multiple sugar transport system ATP-binding protein
MLTRQRDVIQACCNYKNARAYSRLVSTSAPVRFDRVTKVYDGVTALREFSLEITDGEFMVLVGPSGCGKTTALRMVAGLEDITDGEIFIGERSVGDLDPRSRDVAMVFQNYALYPHMTVFENIAFGLRARRAPKSEIRRRVETASQALGLAGLLERKPRQLSGGQRQRVAMGRAIVRNPSVFLMDEPLSNLDARLRVQMRAEVARVQRELGVTTIYVTHDQVEAMTMGDRVAVMRGGVLQQTGDPQFVFDRPANLFVASFIGSPPMNLVEADVVARGDAIAARVGDQELDVPDHVLAERPGLRAYEGRTVGLGIRPEHLHAARDGDPARLRGVARATEALGSELLVHVEVPAEPVHTEEIREVAGDVDAAALERLESEAEGRRTVLVARFLTQERPAVDEPIDVGVDTRRLHFFDLDTGLAIFG